MTDLGLVLQMSNKLGLARKGPNKSATIRRRIFLRRTDANIGLVDVGCGVIHDAAQKFDEAVGHHFFVIVIAKLEGVVEEDVRLIFIIIRVDNLNGTNEGRSLAFGLDKVTPLLKSEQVTNLEVFLRNSPGRLVLVHVEDGLEESQHFVLRLVPHCGACINAGDAV